MTGLN